MIGLLIAIIILLIGLIGMSVIIVRKIPVLAELAPEEISSLGTLAKIKKKIKNSGTLKYISSGMLLQKVLSKIRVLTLKADNKTGTWLMKLRQKTLESKNKFSDDYWKKIRRKK